MKEPKSSAKKAPTNDLGLPLVKPNSIIQKNLKVDYSNEDIKVFRQKLDAAEMELSVLDEQKKAKKLELEAIQDKILKGYEYKQVDCEVFLNLPNSGRKQIVRVDTDEMIEESDMTTEELQIEMDFNKAF